MNIFVPEDLTADYVRGMSEVQRKMRVIVTHHGHFPENPRWPPTMKISLPSLQQHL